MLVDPDVIRVLLRARITLEARSRQGPGTGLYKILAEARAAQRLPWEPTRLSLYR